MLQGPSPAVPAGLKGHGWRFQGSQAHAFSWRKEVNAKERVYLETWRGSRIDYSKKSRKRLKKSREAGWQHSHCLLYHKSLTTWPYPYTICGTNSATGVVELASAGTVMFLAIPAMGSSSSSNVCARRGGGKVSVKSQLQPSDDG